MLWIDKTFVLEEDIAAFSAHVLREADDNKVLDPDEVIRRVLGNLTHEIEGKSTGFGYGSGDIPPNHMAALLNTGVSRGKPPIYIEQLVVDDPRRQERGSALHDWAVSRVIEGMYATAEFRFNDTRITDAKLDWESRASERWRVLKQLGLPGVISPLARPGALRVANSGSFAASDATPSNGSGSLAAASYYVAVTYTDANYVTTHDHRGNGESAPTDAFAVTVAAGGGGDGRITVSIANLNPTPPTTGTFGERVITWKTPTGWNVYAGLALTSMYLQNSTPIPIATQTYNLDTLLTSGLKPNQGQRPEIFFDVKV